MMWSLIAVLVAALMPMTVDWNRVDEERQAFTYGLNAGPWEYGEALYSVVWPVTAPPGTYQVYKSTDGGTTWAEQDSANAPSVDSKGGGIVGSYAPNVAFVGGKLYILKFNTSHQPVFGVFDCSDDSFEATSAAASSSSGGRLYGTWAINSDKIRIYYYNGSSKNFRDYTISSNSWSANDNWPAGKNDNIAVAIDDAGVMHIGFQYTASAKTIRYLQIQPDLSKGGETSIYSSVTYTPRVQPRGVFYGGDLWFAAKIDGREYENNGGWAWDIPLILQVDDYDGTPPVGYAHLTEDDSLELGLSYTYDVAENLCLTVGDGTLRVWAFPTIIYSTTEFGDPPGNWEETPGQWFFVDMKLRHWNWNGANFGQPTVATDEFNDPTWPTSGIRLREYFGLSGFPYSGGFGLGQDMIDGNGDYTYHVFKAGGAGPLAYFGIGKAVAVGADAYAFFL